MAKFTKRWFRRIVTHGVSLCCLGLGSPVVAGLSESDYCTLNKALQGVVIVHLGGLVQLYEAPPGSASELTASEQLLGLAYDVQKGALFRSHQVTEQEYFAYMGAHARAVEEYLSANPVVRDEIQGLKQQLLALVERYEQLKKVYTDAQQSQP